MKGQSINPLIGLMIALIVGIAVTVPVVVDFATQATTTPSITGETVDCTNATTQTLVYDDLLSGTFSLTNGTVTIESGNYTLTASAGTVYFKALNNTIYGSSCVAGYQYYPDAYQTSSTARTMTGLLPLLLVVVIVGLVLAWAKFGRS